MPEATSASGSALAVNVANPAPLGLAAFGLTTIVLSSINAGLVTGDSATLLAVVVPLAFAFGGAAQIIAGILEYHKGNTFGLVAFTSYAMFWWWYSLMLWTVGAGWIQPPAANAVGLTLAIWGVFTLYMWVSTFRKSLTLWIVFLLLWITFFLLAGGDLGMGASWHAAGGYVGVLTGIGALYASFAEMTNETFKREVIPMGAPLVR
ncbi:MAG: acetate uptake transporter [Thermoanaerobaculia bacterium]